MNNGSFNSPSGQPEGFPYPQRTRKSVLPLAVLVFGLLGFFNPPCAVAAIVLGLIDRHLSRPHWDGKSKAGTVLGCVILGICVVTLILILLMYFLVPDFGADLAEGLKEASEIVSSSLRLPLR